jgi:hypothetical protein
MAREVALGELAESPRSASWRSVAPLIAGRILAAGDTRKDIQCFAPRFRERHLRVLAEGAPPATAVNAATVVD